MALVIVKFKDGHTFQCLEHASSLSAIAVIIEERLKLSALADKPVSIAVYDSREAIEDATGLKWNKYPETKPFNYGRYLVWRKGCEKLQFETWNNTGWAYNNNDITHWMEVITPDQLEKEK